jgi:four helix bundle protein
MNKNNPLLQKSFQFSLDIIEYTETLTNLKKYNLANQLFRSGTAIGAMVREAQSPESMNDFIHKLKIAAKEAEESNYWLDLAALSSHYPSPSEEILLKPLNEIQKLLSSIIKTSKEKIKSRKLT